jgi:uncharacterized membrane protein
MRAVKIVSASMLAIVIIAMLPAIVIIGYLLAILAVLVAVTFLIYLWLFRTNPSKRKITQDELNHFIELDSDK